MGQRQEGDRWGLCRGGVGGLVHCVVGPLASPGTSPVSHRTWGGREQAGHGCLAEAAELSEVPWPWWLG